MRKYTTQMRATRHSQRKFGEDTGRAAVEQFMAVLSAMHINTMITVLQGIVPTWPPRPQI